MLFPILRYFDYAHLPPHLAAVSAPFCELAHTLAARAEAEKWDIAETNAGLRKLLEGKDCAVRAMTAREALDEPHLH